ncbi:MAG: phage major capsid protein, partial [Chloroflexi bacterium]|nr:phage major capsid protein [Chloroflexota bacterium]
MPSGYSSDAIGGVLTPERVIPVLYDPLGRESVVLRATPAANIFDAAGGAPVRVPRIAALALADPWRAENTQIAEVDPTYDELTLLPTSLKSLKVLHRLSNELARNSVGNVERLVGDAFIGAIARELDRAFLVGTGSGNTITGLANQTGVQAVTGVGTPTVDDLHDAEGMLMAGNGDPIYAAWFMAPRSFTA